MHESWRNVMGYLRYLQPLPGLVIQVKGLGSKKIAAGLVKSETRRFGIKRVNLALHQSEETTNSSYFRLETNE